MPAPASDDREASEMALRTTVVGSWWKLDEHEDALRRYHAGELSADAR
jgi:methionine synthase II (cobalamin-independent)